MIHKQYHETLYLKDLHFLINFTFARSTKKSPASWPSFLITLTDISSLRVTDLRGATEMCTTTASVSPRAWTIFTLALRAITLTDKGCTSHWLPQHPDCLSGQLPARVTCTTIAPVWFFCKLGGGSFYFCGFSSQCSIHIPLTAKSFLRVGRHLSLVSYGHLLTSLCINSIHLLECSALARSIEKSATSWPSIRV